LKTNYNLKFIFAQTQSIADLISELIEASEDGDVDTVEDLLEQNKETASFKVDVTDEVESLILNNFLCSQKIGLSDS
jgi:hypothetical protein